MGIVLFQGRQQNIDDILKHAGTAMRHAKTSGRNGVHFYDPVMQLAIEARAEMEDELNLALSNEQFHLYYQIQVDNQRRPLGAEVLLRWVHPVRGLVFPGQFIPLMEETGLIEPVGLWVLQTACAQLKAWQDDALTSNLTLSVNVSVKQLRRDDFVAQVHGVLQESGARPSHLKLELTESVVLENVEDIIGKMHELKMLGVSFSMDDFGTGYSSLQYLKRLPLDQLKIDQSFVRDITTDQNDAAIVRTIILMTEALGLNVIAEGVEVEEQEAFLDQNGCRAFQGYLYSKPVPVDQFEALLQVPV
jgi:EAL domain-containing protein (putative c-di-GMP-specific phosphodiesterase class I)